MSNTETELQEATGIEKNATTSKDEYLLNLFQGVTELSVPDWQALSFGARSWYNNAVIEYDADRPIPSVSKKYDNMKESDTDMVSDEVVLSENEETTEVVEEALQEMVDTAQEAGEYEVPVTETVVEAVKEKKPGKRRTLERNLDRFGVKVGSKASTALAMFEKGATMAEVKNITGGTHYNLIRDLPKEGHKVWQEPDGRYVVKHKDDVAE